MIMEKLSTFFYFCLSFDLFILFYSLIQNEIQYVIRDRNTSKKKNNNNKIFQIFHQLLFFYSFIFAAPFFTVQKERTRKILQSFK